MHLLQAAKDDALAPWQSDFMCLLATDAPGQLSAHDSAPSLPGDADGTWFEVPPPNRWLHSAIYDPTRMRMVVFGGEWGGSYHNDVWTLSFAQTPVWTKLSPAGTSPSKRIRQAAVYDPVRNRMVVFGGFDGSVFLNDTWALTLEEPPTWTQLLPEGMPPGPRRSHTAVYDPVRDRIVVFGGYDGSLSLNDTWALTLDNPPTWMQLSPASDLPEPRGAHSAIYDSARDRMVVYGGAYDSNTRSDTWILAFGDTLAWTRLSPTGTIPSGRSLHASVYDPVRHRMLVFGGYYAGFPWNEVWALSLGDTPTWGEVPHGERVWPSDRLWPTTVYDPTRDCMVVFGGRDTRYYNNGTWELKLENLSWSAIDGTMPYERNGASAIFDPIRERMLIFGGWCNEINTPALNDVWSLSLENTPKWEQLSPEGTPPPGRTHHTAIYDPMRDRMVIFGGYRYEPAGGDKFLNDTWALTLTGNPTWTQLSPTGLPPSGRSHHTAVHDATRNQMLVFGGYSWFDPFGNSTNLNESWSLTLGETPTWTQVSTGGIAPTGRGSHSAIYDAPRERMLVFGGYGGIPRNDTWELLLNGTPAWNELSPIGTPPSPRSGSTMIYQSSRDRVVLFGGYDGSTSLNDTWALQLSGTAAWTQLSVAGVLPSPRSGAGSIHDPIRDRMIIIGGEYSQIDTWILSFGPVTAVSFGSITSHAEHGYVELRWSTSLDATATLVVLRSEHADGPYGPVSGEIRGEVGLSDFTYRDTDVQPSTEYCYRIACRVSERWNHSPVIRVVTPGVTFGILGIAPNPLGSGTTRLAFELAQPGFARLVIYDAAGAYVRSLVDGNFEAGTRFVEWDGRGEDTRPLAAGVYFARLASHGQVSSRKIILLR